MLPALAPIRERRQAFAEKPESYAGEFFGADPVLFEPGTWYFDTRDRALVYLVRFPQAMDVVLTMNLYGDILTDLAGAISGGIFHSCNLDSDGTVF